MKKIKKNKYDEIRTVNKMPRQVVKKSNRVIKSENDLVVMTLVNLKAKAEFVAWGMTKDGKSATACVVVTPDVMVSVAGLAKLALTLNATLALGPIDDERMLIGFSW